MPGPSPLSRGSRSNGSKTHPCAHFVRFTEDENKRLGKLCRKRGLSVQAFGHAAMMNALDEAELGKKSVAEVKRENEDVQEKPSTTKGLGIRERLQRDEPPPPQPSLYESPAATITTPMQAAPQARVASVDAEIIALARTIVESPDSARRDVWKSACRALARGRTQEEAMQLADDLDAAIKRLAGTPQTALERVRARMATK